MRRNKKTKILILVFALILMGIGYAYLTANLKIKGTANISNAKWDVHFEDPNYDASDTVTYPSNSNSNVDPGMPVIKGEARQELEWTAIFNSPGDYYYFSADVVNDGDITAELDYVNSFISFKIGDNEEIEKPLYNFLGYNDVNVDEDRFDRIPGLPEYFNYYMNYYDLVLYPNDRGYVSCEIGIDSDKISSEEWESLQGKEIKLNINLKFKQADKDAENTRIRVENPVVNTNGTNANVVPNISNETLDYMDQHKADYTVVFNNPGDYYEFTVDVTNYGGEGGYVYLEDRYITIGDGEKIDIYNINNLPEGLVYDRGIFNGFFPVCQHDTRKVTIRLGIDPNISAEALNALKGKNIKVEYRLESDEGRYSAGLPRCYAGYEY